jgi:hypothetical protein
MSDMRMLMYGWYGCGMVNEHGRTRESLPKRNRIGVVAVADCVDVVNEVGLNGVDGFRL